MGALSYLAMRSIEDPALSHIASEGLRIPTLAPEGLRNAGIALPAAWQEVAEALENLPVTAEIYALAYHLDREVRLFWEAWRDFLALFLPGHQRGVVYKLGGRQ